MPTGKVKWFDVEKGFGFLSRDDGGDVFVHTSALPSGVEALTPGQRVEFGVAEGKRGEQALSVRILEAAPTLAGAAAAATRREPEELHGMIEDMIKLLDTVQRDYRRGKHPDRKSAKKIAEVLHAVAREIEA
ncbi:MAG TPA: cold-shock protein [Mycobacteriales bacterium]|nr:cold-shock protein [Mycobacteriales bacterium]